MGGKWGRKTGLVGLAVVVTGANLFKPYHIDDTAHLIIAQWIALHPMHPMRGLLNWEGVAAPIYQTNQPHLYFYALAVWGSVFGWSEPAMHMLQALFAGACIWLFERLARLLGVRDSLWLTAMLVLGPAFIVEQNLMVDVPLLSVWLLFFNFVMDRRLGAAAGACGTALLIKYSSLVLLPLLAVAALLRRAPGLLRVLVIPLGVLAAWSAFNWFDYGGVHLLTALHASARSYVPPTAHRHFLLARRVAKSLIAWVIAVGALTPLGVIGALQARPRWQGWVYAALLAGFCGLAGAVWAGLIADGVADKALWAGFAASGLLAMLCAGRGVWQQRTPEMALLSLWLLGTSAFSILCAPFIAARHVLLILPSILLLVAVSAEGGLPRQAKTFGLIMTVILSAGLGVSDFRFAQFYKTEAATLPASLPSRTKIWVAGHWGWQWYAVQNGMAEIDIQHLTMAPGDLLLVPEEVDHQLPGGLNLMLIRRVTGNFSAGDPFCTGRPGRFYLSYTFRGPWSLSRDCSQHIDVFRVLAAQK
jgi:hypothetical protein